MFDAGAVAAGLMALKTPMPLTVEVTVIETRLSAISSKIQIYIGAPVTSFFCLSHKEAADLDPFRLIMGSCDVIRCDINK